MPDKGSRGVAVHKGGTFPVEIELGPEEFHNAQPVESSGVAVHTGSRFGKNLVTKDPAAGYNPGTRPSAGTPTWQPTRFGKQDWPDGSAALNPGRK